MKKKLLCLSMMLLLLFLLCSCEKKEQEGSYQLFYLNIDGTKLEKVFCEAQGETPIEIAGDLLSKLRQDPEASDLRKTIPDSVEIGDVLFSGYYLSVDFGPGIYELAPADEVLLRAAIVKTLSQIKGVSYVSFLVEGEAYRDKNGNLIGSMNADSFVENPGEQINSSVETVLTLYYASADGTALVPEKRKVHYSSNISLEKLIMEKLTGGPKTEGLLPTIPTGTKLITLTVMDGVCYVNLDETFRNQNEEITEQVVLYSIVDSLTALDSIDKVQISINGDTSGKCRYNYDLSVMYEEDTDIIQKTVSDAQNTDDTESNTETDHPSDNQEETETEIVTD